ncbi:MULTISPECIES: type I restriction-modification system subunit M N-terminal domain-containing protein [unclassified Synechococcus]|uniref:type I restriction-modification system subunit M N-terminal domain-containing protein n=1 Tax=unclassified Synechococcus TaxID=2626047 RepID=UPI0000698B06|nr:MULTISPECIES: type I restriction-modification system subunit M N-terminal domain-containing protein [unclassified Synechococcus]EAQ74045.1 type I restriction-modification system specificity subunit [Synechococcus sp. WH 5701]WFN58036.1 type I restriction-modification system subunit M N-terminal domain-containing protein [Synechococcus sp. CCFWC 502]
MPDQERLDEFLETLEKAGSPARNPAPREALGWDDPLYEEVKAELGFEAKLWLTADKLRNNMDAAEYKHVVLGLIFLKYIAGSFEEHRAKLQL